DLDLMLLHKAEAAKQVVPVARRLVADFSDVGLKLGFNPRTPNQTLALARTDATVLTTLVESQFLAGNERMFDAFMHRFRKAARSSAGTAVMAIEKARRDERSRYGDTNYLLRPNIKRSA